MANGHPKNAALTRIESTPVCGVLIKNAVAEAYGEAPILQPSLGGSLPDYVWTKILKVPSIVVPYANADESNHAPNENLEVDKFFKGIRCSCSVLSALGKMKS